MAGLELEHHSVSWLGRREHQVPQEEGMMAGTLCLTVVQEVLWNWKGNWKNSGSYGVWLVGWWNTRLNTPALRGG